MNTQKRTVKVNKHAAIFFILSLGIVALTGCTTLSDSTKNNEDLKPSELKLRYFKLSEFRCGTQCDKVMSASFILRVEQLREACGFRFTISSAYRPKNHPIEVKKQHPGRHTQGIAVDILILTSHQRIVIVREALKLGFRGIGIAERFVHIDDRQDSTYLWLY